MARTELRVGIEGWERRGREVYDGIGVCLVMERYGGCLRWAVGCDEGWDGPGWNSNRLDIMTGSM